MVTFIVLAVNDPVLQVKLLVWIFVMRLIMLISSALSYGINLVIVKVRYAAADKMDFETPLTFLVWITSIASIALTFAVSNITIKDFG